MYFYRYLLVIALVGCGGKKNTNEPHTLDLDTCIGTLDNRWDPGGQSPELVGFGIYSRLSEGISHAQRPFGRIDRFDPEQIRLADGSVVQDFSISSNYELVGSVVRNGVKQPLGPHDWKHATFFGHLACPNPQLHGQVLPLRVEVIDDKDIPVPASPAFAAATPPATPMHAYSFSTGDYKGLCADAGDYAIPFPGHWEKDLHYNRTSPLFSFMCVKRDLAKCMLLGHYALPEPAAGQPDWIETCAHAMIADYCGDGQSFTKDKTAIHVWDTGPNAKPPPANQDFSFEAAWDDHGMVCYAKTRWDLTEWAAHGRYAPCVDPGKPTCSSAADAVQKYPNHPLLFTESCKQHPCDIENK